MVVFLKTSTRFLKPEMSHKRLIARWQARAKVTTCAIRSASFAPALFARSARSSASSLSGSPTWLLPSVQEICAVGTSRRGLIGAEIRPFLVLAATPAFSASDKRLAGRRLQGVGVSARLYLPKCSIRASTNRFPICWRVSRVPLPICGESTTRGSFRSASGT